MTGLELTQIKEKIKKAELESASAQGKIEAIQESWKQEYGISTLEEAENKYNEIQKEIEEKTAMRNNLIEKLNNSYNWSEI